MPKLLRQTVNEVYDERNQLKTINADLLAALEMLVEEAREDNQDASLMEAFHQARSAIARARNKE